MVNVKHVLREGNLVAYKLVKLALKSYSRNRAGPDIFEARGEITK